MNVLNTGYAIAIFEFCVIFTFDSVCLNMRFVNFGIFEFSTWRVLRTPPSAMRRVVQVSGSLFFGYRSFASDGASVFGSFASFDAQS